MIRRGIEIAESSCGSPRETPGGVEHTEGPFLVLDQKSANDQGDLPLEDTAERPDGADPPACYRRELTAED